MRTESAPQSLPLQTKALSIARPNRPWDTLAEWALVDPIQSTSNSSCGTAERFMETFHDIGPTDMLACMRAYKEIGFEGVLRPDHVPTLEGESNDDPCYGSLARLHAIGYIQGLREAVYGKQIPNPIAGSVELATEHASKS